MISYSPSNVAKFAKELKHLKELQAKYNLDIPYFKMALWGWKKTLLFVIRQFDSSQYELLFQTERDSFNFALETLKKLPLVNYNKNEVSQVLEGCGVQSEYYSQILNEVFD
jgi:hypothetical protein